MRNDKSANDFGKKAKEDFNMWFILGVLIILAALELIAWSVVWYMCAAMFAIWVVIIAIVAWANS